MSNEKEKTAVEWLFQETLGITLQLTNKRISHRNWELQMVKLLDKAKEMEKEQIGYTKADVIKAGEMGEINYLDTLHITTYLDEAKQYNETYGGNK